MASSGYELKPEISGKQETINIVLWTRDVLKGAPCFGLTTKQHAPETQTASAYQPAPHLQ
jgi:hypothetical protein